MAIIQPEMLESAAELFLREMREPPQSAASQPVAEATVTISSTSLADEQEPTDEELADRLGIPAKKVRLLRTVDQQAISLVHVSGSLCRVMVV